MSSDNAPDSLYEWLPLAEAGVVGLTPLFQRRLSSVALRRKNDRKVTINVSGRKFQTWESTLKRFPDSLLGSSEKEVYYDKQRREYFFDRDPDFFRHILNYYRCGKLHFSEDECGASYEDELGFFRISFEAISLCCLEEFEANRGEQEQVIDDEEEQERCNAEPPHITKRERLWNIFEKPTETLTAQFIYYVTGIAIVVSILTTIVETVPCGEQPCGHKYEKTFKYVDGTCVIILTIEYLVRFYAAPQRCIFFKSFMSIVDVAAVFPFYLDLILSQQAKDLDALTVLRVFRVFRVFKVSRRSTRLQTLGTSVKNSSSELGFILFSFGLGVIIFSTAVFYAERDVKGTTFASIPDGMWYAIVTMTTTG